jgi:hypothetical protein
MRPCGTLRKVAGSARRRASTALLVLLVAGSFASEACSGGCDHTDLVVTPIDRSALDGPVTLEARLTSGGDPVRGAAVTMFVLRDGPNTTSKGRAIGHGDTDADGYLRLFFKRGLAAIEPPPYVIHGYSAEFRFTGSVPGREGELCRAQGEFEFA